MKTTLTSSFIAVSLTSLAPLIGQEKKDTDFIILSNGNSIHATYSKIDENMNVFLSRKGSPTPLTFKLTDIAKLTFNVGHAVPPSKHQGYIQLTNGDLIPGDVKSFDGKTININSSVGEFSFKKEHVARIVPVPLGSALLYSGPYDKENWEVQPYRSTPSSKPDASTAKGSWQLHGAAWYSSPGKRGVLLNKNVKLPDDFVMRFEAAWKNSATFSLAFHADLKNPVNQKEKDVANNLNARRLPTQSCQNLGSSYCLRFQSGRFSLNESGYDEDGSSFNRPVHGNHIGSSGYMHAGSRNYELRVSKSKRMIYLYSDNKPHMEWKLPVDTYTGLGDRFALLNEYSKGAFRISNFMIAAWHGANDTAASLERDKCDVTLLSNGTDRYSGAISKAENGFAFVEGPYSKMKIPFAKIQSIDFAKNQRKQIEEMNGSVTLTFSKHGILRGALLPTSTATEFHLKTKYADLIKIPRKLVTAITREDIGELLELWNDQL